jgi:hypothetical protein
VTSAREFTLSLSSRTHTLLLHAIRGIEGSDGAMLAELITLLAVVTKHVASGNEVLIRPERGERATRLVLVLLTDGISIPETGT